MGIATHYVYHIYRLNSDALKQEIVYLPSETKKFQIYVEAICHNTSENIPDT